MRVSTIHLYAPSGDGACVVFQASLLTQLATRLSLFNLEQLHYQRGDSFTNHETPQLIKSYKDLVKNCSSNETPSSENLWQELVGWFYSGAVLEGTISPEI